MEIAKLVLEFLKVLAWPAVAFTLAFIFRASVRDLVGRIKKASLPGGVELEVSEAKPLAPEEQKQRRENEVRQVASSLSADRKSISPVSSLHLATNIELAETLVLKEIEAEYGGSLRRQVYLHGNIFDAVTWNKRGVTAVEVKLTGSHIDPSVFKALINKAESVAKGYYRNVFSCVIAVVTIDLSPEKREEIRHTVTQLKKDAAVAVDVKVYDLTELKRKYGLAD